MKKILSFVFLFLLCNNVFADWYSGDYKNRIKITIDKTKVLEDLVDYPLLINETNIPDGFWNNVLTDGKDILITKADGVSVLYRELVNIDVPNKKLELWVNSYALSSSNDTVIYLYYNYSSANNSNSSSTWDSNYKIVYHLQTNLTNSSQIGTSGLAVGSPSYLALKIGKGAYMDGNDAIDTNINNIIDTSNNWTISGWINTIVYSSAGQYFVYEERIKDCYGCSITHDSSNKIVLADSYQTAVTSSNAVSDDVNTFVSVSSNETLNKTYIYVGTTLTTSNAKFTWTINNNNPLNHPMQFGRYWVGTLKGGYWIGGFDEIRVSDISRSNNYQMTAYNNQNSISTFYSIGSIESNIKAKLIIIEN